MNKIMTLGQALACLHYEKVTGNRLESLSKSDSEYLKYISTKLNKPDTASLNVLTFKQNNTQDYTDLFIEMFSKDNNNKGNPNLLKSFNDNFECFEAYTIVLNDFLQKLEDLKKLEQE